MSVNLRPVEKLADYVFMVDDKGRPDDAHALLEVHGFLLPHAVIPAGQFSRFGDECEWNSSLFRELLVRRRRG